MSGTPSQILARKTFSVSRLSEFASKAELVKQTGHDADDWPLVVLKELVDNALDAAEEAETAPSIEVAVDKDSITVADNGSGMPEETIASAGQSEDKSRQSLDLSGRGAP